MTGSSANVDVKRYEHESKYKHYDVLSEFFHCNVLEDVPVSGEAVDSLTAYRTPGIMNFILQAECLAVSEVAACILSQSHTLHSSSVLPEYSSTLPPTPSVWPRLFCGAGHEKRRGEQLKWSLAFRLYIGSFVFHVHSYQDQLVHTARLGRVCFIFSLGLYFACLYCFNLSVCPHPFVFP